MMFNNKSPLIDLALERKNLKSIIDYIIFLSQDMWLALLLNS